MKKRMAKKELSQELKKRRDKASNILTLRLSHSETSVLEKLMEKEEWTNRSGFIKYKIFGDSEEYQYKKMLESGEPSDIIKVIVNLMSELNRQIDYINYRFDSELIEFKKKIEEFDETKAKQWLAFLQEWKNGLQAKTDEIFFDCQTILKAINIKIERKDYKDVSKLPDYVLDRFAKDWNDTTSPERKERGRRLMEKFYKENPDIAARERKKKKEK